MEKHAIEELIQQSLSQREIANRLGCSQSTVKYWLKQFGLKTQKVQFNEKAIQECDCGESNPSKFVNRDKGRSCRSVCRRCHQKQTILRYRSKKLKAIEYKGGKCQKCGYDKCPGSLQFHHRNPSEKNANWKYVRSWSFDKIKKELDKCDLLCANCHGEVHWLDGAVV
jgi:predicted transcriptional regulator